MQYVLFASRDARRAAADNGEFYTPPSIVRTIVNVIEPEHGIVHDPACGTGGMFVQSSHFIERAGKDPMKRVTFYGHEKNETTAKLAQINLAVNSLEGKIRAGNEAITYYEDPHELVGKRDFVMANPPFNVDEVDAKKAAADQRRLPFGLPGVNKNKKVSNANYLCCRTSTATSMRTGAPGIELGVDAAVNQYLNVFTNYSYQFDPEVEGFPISEINLPPNNRFNVGFNFSYDRFLGNMAVNYTSDAFWQDVLDARYAGTTDAYTLVNAGFGVRWGGDRLVTSLKITNLTNEEILQHIFGDVIRRTIAGELRFTF
jgi:hypothetical protein